MFWTILTACLVGAEPAPPFPAALEAAAVTQDRLDNQQSRAMLLGNGDLMALVYSDGADLIVHLSKTDVWDARIDTSADPELPSIDPAKRTFRGASDPPSWNKRTYPCGVPFGRVRLKGAAPAAGLTARLDLARGLAQVATGAGTTQARVLWQANALLLDTPALASLEGDPFDFLPAATTGADGDVQWLRQDLPGDTDYAGMEVAVALAGAVGRQVVAVVTSREAKDPRAAALALARRTLSGDATRLTAEHERGWRGFWARSGVALAVPEFERWWYRQVYYLGCFSRPGKVAVGLKAGLDGLAGWHNSYKFNYNTQQTYFSPGPVNHPELAEPIVEAVYQYLPRAKWLAKTCFVGCEGAFVHSDVWPYEPDPAVCASRNRRQLAYMPWGFSLGMNGMIATTLWESYLYRPDRDYLARRIYPVLSEMARFYCSFVEKCPLDAAGKTVLGPSFYPEQGGFGQMNTAWDIAYVHYGLSAALSAAQVLGRDKDLAARIQRTLALLPTYSTVPDPRQGNQSVVEQWLGAGLRGDNHCSCVQPVFPGAQVHWFSPAADQELFRRTIRYQYPRSAKNNPVVMVNISRARLSMTADAHDDTLTWFRRQEQPNGLFHWEGHGFYISEQAAVSRLVTEFLLQSVDNTIRIFPAWPKEQDARFAGLRAQGGFLVSAELNGGTIRTVTITSTVGGRLRVLSPWTDQVIERDTRPGQVVELRAESGAKP
ncbi:MAG: hypothetical protein HZB16_19165 [Armatimonadetes bacterium]|nr:hypothetical protein [Armatimonadota bacterium]